MVSSRLASLPWIGGRILPDGGKTNMMPQTERAGVWFIYDGECPLCTSAAQALRIKRQLGALHLINARQNTHEELVAEVTNRGFDLDEGMVIYHQGQFYHGKEALKFMARHGSAKNVFSVFCKSLFGSNFVSGFSYPWLRGARNMLLRRKNVGRIDNLNLKDQPTFKPIFGTSWEGLPPAIKKHYANRPYTHDSVIVHGVLDVSCSGFMRALAPLFWLLKSVPPVNEGQVPVTVHFESEPDTKVFRFDRVFHFKNRKPYHFRSRMVQVKDNEVMEIMRFGICWRMHYSWNGEKVLLRHQGYAVKILGHFISLPLTSLLGRGDAEEVPVADNAFAMCATITHPLLGKIYEYKGTFTVQESA
jgi:predicted DCC family thiol-disulfide oxidoreductase YuxK